MWLSYEICWLLIINACVLLMLALLRHCSETPLLYVWWKKYKYFYNYIIQMLLFFLMWVVTLPFDILVHICWRWQNTEITIKHCYYTKANSSFLILYWLCIKKLCKEHSKLIYIFLITMENNVTIRKRSLIVINFRIITLICSSAQIYRAL